MTILKKNHWKSIRRICNKEDPNNKAKIEKIKRININNNLDNPKIKELTTRKENKHCFRQYKDLYCKMVQKAAEILNINLIFLRLYCPDLNPIEEVWRVIKKITYTNYNFTKDLINLFKDKFYEIIKLKSFYENWLEQMV